LFSLGVVLYDMVTGRLPFTGVTPTDTIGKILHTEPEPMTRFKQNLPAELEGIVCKCLEKDRDLRYQHASDVRADLERLKRSIDSLGSVSVGAKGKGVSHLRERRWIGALVVVLAALLVGIGITWYGKGRSEPPAETVLTPIPLTTYPGSESNPSFSPDG